VIYWQCQRSTSYILHIAAVLFCLNSLQLAINLHLLAHLVIILSSIVLVFYAEKVQQTLPLAVSYHKEYWRMSYGSYHADGQLVHGFVLGPVAYMRVVTDKPQADTRLWVNYWQVINPERQSQGNWRQLVTLIRTTRP
jgi:hypothetical protein